MSNEDFKYLRDRVDSIHEIVSKGSVRTENLEQRMGAAEREIEPLKSGMNKVKGAIALVGFLVTLLGALHLTGVPARAIQPAKTSSVR